MQTQITCPQCGTPYTAEVHQVVDTRQNPELKQQLLNGRLNLAICPQCGAGGRMATLMLFHDPEHELFMVHVPPELNLDEMQREQMIGQLTKQVMDETPPEERRAYMFQPQMMLNWETFMEKVLETEGITPEMIARQKKQSELLQTLAQADKDVQTHLIQERMDEIDETFFAMLQSYIDAASQMNDNKQLIPLVNLRARLMTETLVGQRMEAQQIAIHKLSREAKSQDGLTPELLLKHILANQQNPSIVDALVRAGQGAIQYEFFSLLSDEIEKEEKAGNTAVVERLSALRQDLLQMYEEMQNQSRQLMEGAMATVQAILDADDKEQALAEHADAIDDAFMAVLMARMQDAEEKGRQEELQALTEIHSLIVGQLEQQMPPQIQLLNQLVQASSPEKQADLLSQNEALVSEELIELIDGVLDQVNESGQDELNDRLQGIKTLIQTRL